MENKGLKKFGFQRNQKGVALLLAMFILVFIAILAVVFLELLTSDLQITSNHSGKLKALYIADAGIEHAVSRLRANRNWTANSQQIVFPSGSSSSYTITYPKAGTTRTIVSAGSLENNRFTATVEAKISIQGSSSPYNIKIVSWSEI